MCADVLVCISPKTFQKDVAWFHAYLILFLNCPFKKWSGGFCAFHTDHCYTSSSGVTISSGGRCLPAEPGTSAGPATDIVPGVADAEAVAAGCSTAAGPAGSSHLHLAGHTEAVSVGRAKQSKNVSRGTTGYEIRLCHIRIATWAEVIYSAIHLMQKSYSFTQQFMQALKSSCLSRRSKPECSVQLLFSGRAFKENIVLLNTTIP